MCSKRPVKRYCTNICYEVIVSKFVESIWLVVCHNKVVYIARDGRVCQCSNELSACI